MREKTEAYLGKISPFNLPKPADSPPKPLSAREKMDLSDALLQDPNSDEGAKVLLSLLAFETESDYWLNYVFNRCFRLRENRAVQQFLADCLQSDNETRFKKSCDVLMFWGFNLGEKALTDRALMNALNWEDASANNPDFRAALEKILKIILTNQ